MIELELDGERRQVAVRREGDRWIAEIDGRTMDVSVAEVSGRWSMLVGPPSAFAHSASAFAEAPADKTADEEGGHYASYEISFEPTAAGELIVHVNGVAIPLTIASAPGSQKPLAKAAGRGAGKPGEGAGPRMVVAPMPGRIVKVLVKPNESVSARQPLVVVEAMKMENELRAPRSGTVAEVRVAEGSSVEANTVLVVLE